MSDPEQQTTENASGAPRKQGFRSRRTHTKSRHGCMRCKQRRKKCDERTPRCSRCVERNVPCEYPRSTTLESSPPQLDSLWHQVQNLTIPSPNYASSISGAISTTSSNVSPRISPFLSSNYDVDLELLQAKAQPTQALNSTELELLSHYLSHTARAIAFDSQDLYVLKVGFPNLAFRSKPLMSSVLALAAVCKCHDIITQPGTQAQDMDRDQIRNLLALADQHHGESLRQTQAEIPVADYYDHVLANAPLMVLYASASHCVRIRLVQREAEDGNAVSEFAPGQSQWISLIRAAHLAYTGLLNAPPDLDSPGEAESSCAPSLFCDLGSPLQDSETILGEDGPTEQTRNLFLPILSSTSGPALDQLRSRAFNIHALEVSPISDTDDRLTQHPSLELQACFVSLEVLSNIMDEVFHPGTDSPHSSLDQSAFDASFPPMSKLSEVSPWLRSYLARVTSATLSRPLRRTITSFLNRVPAEYLRLVQAILDVIPVDAANQDEIFDQEWEQSSPTHQLAMDIFAHWLVLVLLLDGVWWLGEIGNWELERVVSFMCRRGWVDDRRSWWPKTTRPSRARPLVPKPAPDNFARVPPSSPHYPPPDFRSSPFPPFQSNQMSASSGISPGLRAASSFDLRAPLRRSPERSTSAFSPSINGPSPDGTSTDAAEECGDEDEIRSRGEGKRRRLTTTDFTRRKRAVTACHFCRMRKTKCDNVRPKCGYCVRQKAKCVYGDGGEGFAEEDGEEAVTNRQLMDRLEEIKEMLQRSEISAGSGQNEEASLLTPDAARASAQTPLVTSPWARFAPNAPYEASASVQAQRDQRERFPFETLRCESLLRWPALRSVVPSDALEIDSFPLSSGYTEGVVQGKGQGSQGISEESFVPLCRKFLALVHPRNPVLDGNELMRLARSAEEHGLKWDSASCLLLTCALAAYTEKWVRPNSYPVPVSQQQLEELIASDEEHVAEPYYAAAQKRIGLLGNTIQDMQCFFFATIFEKFALRPLRAWYYVQQACSRLETRLLQRGERPWAPFREQNPKDYHLEQRLFWSCFRAESELVFELGLKPSALENFSYPHPFPSPPEGLSSQETPRTDGSQIDPDEEQRQVDERGWCYYLSEISIRRTIDETLNVLYRQGEEYWMKNPSQLIRQYHECEQQITQWHYHLPDIVQFDDDTLPEEEFAAALQGRAALWREYTLRPILYYVLHHQGDDPIPPEAQALAAKEMSICAGVVYRLAFHRRHGGTWLTCRKSFMCACLILTAAVNPHRVEPPEGWHRIIAIAVQTLRRWEGGAVDLGRMADMLRDMYCETCRRRGEDDMMCLVE
ncbi:hypothetical protein ACJZ2D_009278 [Fusarium nematophilum]